MIDFGREICGDPVAAASREWLVTNGIGGYATGTISGEITRRYQGLLVATLHPPVERMLLVSKLAETVTYDDAEYTLTTDHLDPGEITPTGYLHIERFRLDGSVPVWTFAIADALLEKRIWMEYLKNTAYVRYTVLRGSLPVTLTVEPLVTYRGNHALLDSAGWYMETDVQDATVLFNAGNDALPFQIAMPGAEWQEQQQWSEPFFLSVDDERGIHPYERYLKAGRFTVTLQQGDSTTLVAATERETMPAEATLERRVEREKGLIRAAAAEDEPDAIRQLVLAADQFIVRRNFAGESDGRSILAGYPWFEDWGRDTMIALPGLTLVTGRTDVAEKILRTYGAAVSKGMLPNRFPEDGSDPVYNTNDASPWFFEAIRAYFEATDDRDLLTDLFPILEEMVDWHERGTRFGIRFDPEDGLVSSTEEGAPLTWMDARMGDFVPTPRVGKPVEISALWYNALCAMADFARSLGKESERYESLAARLCEGFDRFWNADRGYLFDVLDGPDGDDPSLRPNQLLAVSLHHSPLNDTRQTAIVDVCARHLLTSHGMRSLARHEQDYNRVYRGNLRQRDGAYHQGTVWSWLIGPFVSAHYRVYQDRQMARSFLQPLFLHMRNEGLGTISEIFDAEPPHTGRGCFAQAWGVSEILRTWAETAE